MASKKTANEKTARQKKALRKKGAPKASRRKATNKAAGRPTPTRRGGTTGPPRGAKRPARESAAASDAPALFRLNVEVGALDGAVAFYEMLLGVPGRPQRGARAYFTCGAVTLQVVDVSSAGTPHPAAESLYFVVRDLEAVFARARGLGCLSLQEVHGAPGGAIVVRPWGERSFYVEDPWRNPLCFVEAGTVYEG